MQAQRKERDDSDDNAPNNNNNNKPTTFEQLIRSRLGGTASARKSEESEAVVSTQSTGVSKRKKKEKMQAQRKERDDSDDNAPNNNNNNKPTTFEQLIRSRLGGTASARKSEESKEKQNPISINEEEDCEPCESLGYGQQSKEMFKRMPSITTPSQTRDTTTTPSAAQSHSKPNGTEYWKREDPPDFNELGHSTWTFLHTMAAYYPNNPSAQKKQQVSSILHAIPHVYPCTVCAKDFEQILVSNPPKVESRRELSQWLCEAHNHVNEITGKPTFDCKDVEKRWRRFIDHTEAAKSKTATPTMSVNTVENPKSDSH
eukprot:TRINITY_DN4830_c0_g1_i1.p1 TRINITY_DN4830_c0_g1~~TRINITY_DN4830_c0_g1_i1.p1  ORF type:complete len:341 (+),score=114.00 TRINITY_DN4830_c0_g1_i1:81-1025(+)